MSILVLDCHVKEVDMAISVSLFDRVMSLIKDGSLTLHAIHLGHYRTTLVSSALRVGALLLHPFDVVHFGIKFDQFRILTILVQLLVHL